MFGKYTAFILVVGLMGIAIQTTGCDKSVKQFCHRLNECSDEVAEQIAIAQKVPKTQIPQAKKLVAKQFKDEKSCRKQFKGKTIKTKGRVCLKKKSCKEFAQCFAKAMTKGK